METITAAQADRIIELLEALVDSKPLDGFMSADEAAKLWRMNKDVVQRKCRNGEIQGARKRGRKWLIPREEKVCQQ